MSRFRKERHDVPGLNLAAMPDLIFTVLFFFMIVTHMRDITPRVRYEVPQGSEVAEAADKSNVVYIFVGLPTDDKGQTVSENNVVQLNDKYVGISQIGAEIMKMKASMSEEQRQHLTVSIRADRNTDMGTINDIKQQLRKAGALNINFSATKTNKKIKEK